MNMISHAFAAMALLASAANAATLAERLGYPSDARLLIVHGDDMGMCHGANASAKAAFESGAVSSGSAMVPCPWFPAFAAMCRENPQWDVGIHLALTSEWREYRWKPVADPADVPGLLDEEGYLHRDVRSVALRASAKEVETECRAQIERAFALGVKPTHLDSHMGTLFARPDFFEVYYKLAVEYGIPAMIPSPTPETVEAARRQGYPITERFIELAESGIVPALDALVTGVPSGDLQPRTEEYHRFIRELKPGVTQIIVHLGDGSDEMRAITGSWKTRHNDFLIWSSGETRALLKSEGIVLIGWRELAALMAKPENNE